MQFPVRSGDYCTIKSSRPEGFCTKSVLKSSAKFTGEHLCWIFFLIKLQTLRPAALLKGGSSTSAFLWIFRIFEE